MAWDNAVREALKYICCWTVGNAMIKADKTDWDVDIVPLGKIRIELTSRGVCNQNSSLRKAKNISPLVLRSLFAKKRRIHLLI